jgi:hypothetical protein
MTLLRVAALFLMVMMTGCGGAEWVHPNKPKDAFAVDYNRCDNQSMQDPKLQGGTKLVQQQAIERCLAKTGWVLREKRD